MKNSVRFILNYLLALIIYNSIMFIFDQKIDLADALLLPLVVTIIIGLVFKTKEKQ